MKRCLCLNTTPNVVIDPPGYEDCMDCFYIPSLYLAAKDSVGPCGETGTIDLLEHANVTICNENNIPCTITWKVISWGKGFSVPPVVSNGILSFTTANELTPSELTWITVKAECPCKELGTFVKVKIAFKDLCKDIVCPTGQYCNPCDASCLPKQSDLSINKEGISSVGGTGLTLKI